MLVECPIVCADLYNLTTIVADNLLSNDGQQVGDYGQRQPDEGKGDRHPGSYGDILTDKQWMQHASSEYWLLAPNMIAS